MFDKQTPEERKKLLLQVAETPKLSSEEKKMRYAWSKVYPAIAGAARQGTLIEAQENLQKLMKEFRFSSETSKTKTLADERPTFDGLRQDIDNQDLIGTSLLNQDVTEVRSTTQRLNTTERKLRHQIVAVLLPIYLNNETPTLTPSEPLPEEEEIVQKKLANLLNQTKNNKAVQTVLTPYEHGLWEAVVKNLNQGKPLLKARTGIWV